MQFLHLIQKCLSSGIVSDVVIEKFLVSYENLLPTGEVLRMLMSIPNVLDTKVIAVCPSHHTHMHTHVLPLK